MYIALLNLHIKNALSALLVEGTGERHYFKVTKLFMKCLKSRCF